MEQSMGKITWGYIWRWIVLGFATAFVLTIVLRLLMGVVASGSDTGTTVLHYKIYLIGSLIISVISIILACKFATSDIKKKFLIDGSNAPQVFKRIVIVLIVITVIFAIYQGVSSVNLKNQLEEVSAQVDSFKDLLQQYSSETLNGQLKEQVAELESFLGFGNAIVIVSIVVNIVTLLLMIPFEKKLLKV